MCLFHAAEVGKGDRRHPPRADEFRSLANTSARFRYRILVASRREMHNRTIGRIERIERIARADPNGQVDLVDRLGAYPHPPSASSGWPDTGPVLAIVTTWQPAKRTPLTEIAKLAVAVDQRLRTYLEEFGVYLSGSSAVHSGL